MSESVKENKLGNWLQIQLDLKNMNVAEYAESSKVAHTILFRILNGSATPTLKTLDRLARYSHTDIGYLAGLCFPDAVIDNNPNIRDIAEQINNLPPVYREAMVAMINGLLAQQEASKDG